MKPNLKSICPNRVLDQNKVWKHAVLRIIKELPKGTAFTFDRIRAAAVVCKLDAPAHPNAWGSVLRCAAKEWLIQKTGRYLPSAIRSNHSRIVPEWRRL